VDRRSDADVEALTAALRSRILVLDGAMGTAIQRDRPDEAGYRGARFADWPSAAGEPGFTYPTLAARSRCGAAFTAK